MNAFIMSTIEPSIFKTIFKPESCNSENAVPKQAEPKPGTSTNYTFTPREAPKTPQQQQLSRTVYSHVARLHVLITDWKKNRDKSYKIGKAIYALNLSQYEEDCFPRELQPLMESLMEILGDLGDIFEEVTELENRLLALAKLQPNDEPVLTTWSVGTLARKIHELGKQLKREYQLLETVIENIAHDRDEDNRAVYAVSLGPTPYVSTEAAFIFSEAGLAPV